VYSVFIVARVQIYREGIAALFASNSKFEVSGSAMCLSASLDAPANAVIVDCSAMSPSLLAQYCNSRTECPPVVAFGVPDNINVALALLEAGAMAYVGSESTAADLYNTVLGVIEESVLLPASVTSALLERLRARSSIGLVQTFRCLTPRELQVAELMAEHRSNKEIAVALGISLHTVKVHVHHVIQKLALDRRSEAQDTLMGVGLR
jgi:two-component system nitrate/nitrite response regulator NarL